MISEEEVLKCKSKDSLIKLRKKKGGEFSIKGNFHTCRKRALEEVGKQMGQVEVKSQENASMGPEKVCMVSFRGEPFEKISVSAAIDLIAPCSLDLLLNKCLSYRGYNFKEVVL